MRKFPVLMAAAAAGAVFAGCCTITDSAAENEMILTELKTLNAKLDTLSEKLKENTEAVAKVKAASAVADRGGRAVSHTNRGADMEALEKIKLPEEPTKEDIKKYIGAIMKATEKQNSFSSSDPQVDMYRQIGGGYLEVILPYLRQGDGMRNWHIQYAADSLVGLEDKELALKKLKEYPQLAVAIVKNGWIEDAREELFDVLEKMDHCPQELIKDAAQLVKTDEDRQRIIDIYCTRPNRQGLLNVIRTFPGVDLKAITEKAFENFRFTQLWTRRQYAEAAAKNGSLKALDGLIDMMQESQMGNNSHMRDQFGTVLISLTGRPANADALRKWFDENKDNLVFNKERGRFEVKK